MSRAHQLFLMRRERDATFVLCVELSFFKVDVLVLFEECRSLLNSTLENFCEFFNITILRVLFRRHFSVGYFQRRKKKTSRKAECRYTREKSRFPNDCSMGGGVVWQLALQTAAYSIDNSSFLFRYVSTFRQ